MSSAFELFDLPAGFDIDEKLLHQRFIQASAANHPDRFSDPLEQAEAAEKSAAINEAYRTLKDPESRANHLLALRGGASKSDDKSLPPDLLMEMMEVRERMEQAIETCDESALRELSQWAQQQRAEHLARIGGLFRASPEDADLVRIRLELNALRYFQRMIEQVPQT